MYICLQKQKSRELHVHEQIDGSKACGGARAITHAGGHATTQRSSGASGSSTHEQALTPSDPRTYRRTSAVTHAHTRPPTHIQTHTFTRSQKKDINTFERILSCDRFIHYKRIQTARLRRTSNNSNRPPVSRIAAQSVTNTTVFPAAQAATP